MLMFDMRNEISGKSAKSMKSDHANSDINCGLSPNISTSITKGITGR